jgi:hypothetical protein
LNFLGYFGGEFLSKEPAQQGMLSNNAYDLMAQLTEENQSLWRIKNNYKKDAANDKEALDFWNYLEKDKQDHIKKLTELLESRIRA